MFKVCFVTATVIEKKYMIIFLSNNAFTPVHKDLLNQYILSMLMRQIFTPPEQ